MHVPGATNVIVVPETVHTPVVADVNPTVNELDEVALKATVPEPKTLSARGPKVIVCPIFATVIVKLEVEAVAFIESVKVTETLASPAAVGVPEINPVEELRDRPDCKVPVSVNIEVPVTPSKRI